MHKMEYSAMKKIKILIPATAWINLETMISEVSQTQKDKYDLCLLVWGTYDWQTQKESTLEVARGWRVGKGMTKKIWVH
jgi:hypothetical protein